MSNIKDYNKKSDCDEKEWWNCRNEYKEEYKKYWNDYHNMTKKTLERL